MERVVTGLRARGVPQVVLAPRSVADVLGEVERLGAKLGAAKVAAGVAEHLRREVAELRARRRGEPVRVYLEWWPRPMFTPGRDCYSNELIALAGGLNVFGDRPGSSVEITPGDLVAARPDVCFVSWCGVAADKLDPGRLRERPGLAELSAVRQGHVYPLDEAFAGRPGPRMLEAARMMASAIERVRAAGGGR
jgi:iron complex transport system substrate-binding protein